MKINISIQVPTPSEYSDILLEDIEHTELTVEQVVSAALLEVFEAVTTEEVKIEYEPTGNSSSMNIRLPVSEEKLAKISTTRITKDIEEALEAAFSKAKVKSLVFEREPPDDSPVIEEALRIAKSRDIATNKEMLRDGEEREDQEKQVTEPLAKGAAFRIQIVEEPLTAQNLITITSAITELATKCWLIAKRRFADLIDYTQTHNPAFAEEANAIVTRISYNSPFNMDWKVDLSAPSVAEALVKTIDGIKQRDIRLELTELEAQAKAQQIKEAEQRTEQDNQKALLEQEEQRLKLEQRRLELLEKQLEMQKKRIEYAMELAGKMIDLLHPGTDPATRAMEIQTLLPNIIQLQSSKGLGLALPIPQENKQEPPRGETDKP